MAAISLSYLTSAVNVRAFLRFLLSSRYLRLRYRLQPLAERSASILTLAAVFFMAFVGVTE